MTPATSRTSTTWSWSWRTVGRWASGSAATARPPAQAARVAYQVCQALASAHQAGVVHGNLTPANILLAADGSVKVIDFATGGSDPGTLPPSRQQFQDAGGPSADPGGGWTGVVAPEAAAGGQPDGRADLYALGGCLYQMLTGRPPAPSGSPAGPGDQAMVCSPRAVLAGIPRELDQLVRQAMAGDPASRYQNADTMAVALAEAVPGLEDGVNAAGPPASPPVGWPAAHAEPTAGEGFLRHEGRWLGWALALVSLAAALAILGLTLGDSLGRDLVAGGAGTQREAGTATGTGGAGAILRLAGAFAYDPLGDGHENDDQAPKAIDQNPATAWTTQHYRRLALGASNPGSGWSWPWTSRWPPDSWSSGCSARAAASRCTAPAAKPLPGAFQRNGHGLAATPTRPVDTLNSPWPATTATAGTWCGSPGCPQPLTTRPATKAAPTRRPCDPHKLGDNAAGCIAGRLPGASQRTP